MILRIVVVVVAIVGIRYLVNTKKAGDAVNQEQQYTQKMSELTSRYQSIEQNVKDVNAKILAQPAKTPGSARELTQALSKAYDEKDKYLADLRALDVPKKYEEAHKTFVEWQKQEHETEGKLLEGYKAYYSGQKQIAGYIDSLLENSDKVSKAYKDKMDAITKSKQLDAFKAFLNQKTDK